MRIPRIKAPEGEDALYHCTSRIVGGHYLFGVKEKEFFVRLMWRVAEFLSIEILDYVVMSNHFHQLVFVPGRVDLSDAQLLQRLRVYYGERGHHYLRFQKALKKGGHAAELLRNKHIRRMGNISEFEKILKQSFSTWYNRMNDRKGTLWMERFGSVLTEDSLNASTIVASYIDLNPVRARMVTDPANYRHCGYGAAMGGDPRCRRGIMRIMGMDSWKKASEAFRLHLMQRGHVKVPAKSGTISRELLLKTLQTNGSLDPCELLRLRVRYFCEGLALGSKDFVDKVFQQYSSHFGEKRKSGSRPIEALPDSGLCVIRNLRKPLFS
ncbi:MAG: transposase [Oceanipulchritudo sp.]